jgi:PKD repeat protein
MGSLFAYVKEASAYIDHPMWSGTTEYYYDANKARVDGTFFSMKDPANGYTTNFVAARATVSVNGQDVGKVINFVREKDTSNNGFLFIDTKYIDDWINFFGPDNSLQYVKSNLKPQTVTWNHGKNSAKVVSFAQLASLAGGRPDPTKNYDVYNKICHYVKTPKPDVAIKLDTTGTILPGSTFNFHVWGKSNLISYDTWVKLDVGGGGSSYGSPFKSDPQLTKYLSGTVPKGATGSITINVTATDSSYRQNKATLVIPIGTSVNPPPPVGGGTYPGGIMVDFDPEPSPQTVNSPVVVTDTSNSSCGTITKEVWSISPTTGVSGKLSGKQSSVTFTKSGDYTITLTATDGCGKSGTKTKTITITDQPSDPPPPPVPPQPQNKPPVAKVKAPWSAHPGKPVTIDGSGSYDPDNGPSSLSYDWSVSPSGYNGTLSDTGGTLTFSKEGTYTVKLTVNDGEDSDSDTQDIEVTNNPPRAQIDVPNEVIQGDDVVIKNRSYDPDGDNITKVQWTIPLDINLKDSATDDPVTTLQDTNNVYFDKPGTYTIGLHVEDEFGATDDTTETVVVKPAIPNAYFELAPGSTPKENRKIVVDATKSTSSKRYPMDWSKTEWQFVPPTGVSSSVVKVVDDPNMAIRTLLIKKPGVYNFRVRVTNSAGNTSEWFERAIEITPDTYPHVDFYVPSSVTRDPSNGNKAAIYLMDQSYSDDGDIITQRVWKYQYDSNNDGSFLDEQWQTLDSGNNPNPTFYTNQVGKYQFQLEVTESFGQETIPAFITPADTRMGDTTNKIPEEKQTEVINIPPLASFGQTLKKKVDVFVTVGQTDPTKVSDLTGKITRNVASKLGANNIDYVINTAQTLQMSLQSNFAWQEYTHTYTDAAYHGTYVNGTYTTDHIVVNGTTIGFYGYGQQGAKDFLFLPDTSQSKKVFDFDVNETVTDWHTLEGAGFLFNAKIENGLLYGYSILLASGGIQLYEIKGVDVNNFHEGYGNYWSLSNFATKIGTYPKYGSTHSIHIEVTPDKIDLSDKGTKIINGQQLPDQLGNGFGPMASYNPHNCSSLSQIAFNNIRMQTISGKSLDEVLKEPTWRENATRFTAQISDVQIPEFQDPQKAPIIYSRLLNDCIDYSVLGTSANQSQAQQIIALNTDKGTFINNSNMDNALSSYADYIINLVNAQSSITNYVLEGQDVDYQTFYNDMENDPEIARKWQFTHTNPYYFQNSQGTASFSGQWLTQPITKFANVGEYEVEFMSRDEPKHDDRFDNYRLWSLPSDPKLKLYVHRKPIAQFSTVLTPDASGVNYYLNVSDQSYDLDHQYEADKGIRQRDWKWRYSDETYWHTGMPPSFFPGGKTMIVYLRVLDPENTWSDPEVKVLTTQGNLPPVADFEIAPNPVPLSKALTYTDHSYDPNNDPIVNYHWRYQPLNGSWIDLGYSSTFNTLPPKTFPAIGQYRIELTVQDSKGAWSEPFYNIATVIPDNRPPVAKFTINPNPVPQDVKTSYTDQSWDPDNDPIVQREWRMKKTTDTTWTTITEPPTDVSGLVPGNYQIQLRCKDQPPLPQLDPLWSSWYEQILTVTPKNEKPVAHMLITPTPGESDEPVTWTDKSTDPEGLPLTAYELRITQQESGIVKFFTNTYSKASGAPMDLSGQLIQIFETSGFPNDGVGTYKVEFRVRDTSPPPGLSPVLWSDWEVQAFTVEEPLTITGQVNPSTAHSGETVSLTANTAGKAQNVYVKIDWNRDGQFDGPGETVILAPKYSTTSKLNDWEGKVLVPLPTTDGNYDVIYTATKTSPWDGSLKTATDKRVITIKGSIFDDYIMEYYK